MSATGEYFSAFPPLEALPCALLRTAHCSTCTAQQQPNGSRGHRGQHQQHPLYHEQHPAVAAGQGRVCAVSPQPLIPWDTPALPSLSGDLDSASALLPAGNTWCCRLRGRWDVPTWKAQHRQGVALLHPGFVCPLPGKETVPAVRLSFVNMNCLDKVSANSQRPKTLLGNDMVNNYK